MGYHVIALHMGASVPMMDKCELTEEQEGVSLNENYVKFALVFGINIAKFIFLARAGRGKREHEFYRELHSSSVKFSSEQCQNIASASFSREKRVRVLYRIAIERR